MKSCPECGSRKVEWNKHELTCNKCGAIIKESYYSGERIVV